MRFDVKPCGPQWLSHGLLNKEKDEREFYPKNMCKVYEVTREGHKATSIKSSGNEGKRQLC